MKSFKLFAKIVLISFALFLALSYGASAQTIQRDPQGNYKAIKKAHDSTTAVATGTTYTDSHGGVWPVYRSKSGREYALVTSKNGNVYRKYMSKEIDKD